jgi:hypothetical protein
VVTWYNIQDIHSKLKLGDKIVIKYETRMRPWAGSHRIKAGETFEVTTIQHRVIHVSPYQLSLSHELIRVLNWEEAEAKREEQKKLEEDRMESLIV